MDLKTCYYSSPIGTLEIKGSIKGIRSILYSSEESVYSETPECLLSCITQLTEYFEGARKSFSLDLDPEGTVFQLKVWELLLTIPYGHTITYSELAVKTGDIKAVRAVGHANGQNKLNIVVPCHRVIGANGKLTGYGGGLWRKDRLLKLEMKDQFPELFSM